MQWFELVLRIFLLHQLSRQSHVNFSFPKRTTLFSSDPSTESSLPTLVVRAGKKDAKNKS